MLHPTLARNNVNIIGNGQQVILFAHGFGCDQTAWQFVIDAFTDDFKVVFLRLCLQSKLYEVFTFLLFTNNTFFIVVKSFAYQN